MVPMQRPRRDGRFGWPGRAWVSGAPDSYLLRLHYTLLNKGENKKVWTKFRGVGLIYSETLGSDAMGPEGKADCDRRGLMIFDKKNDEVHVHAHCGFAFSSASGLIAISVDGLRTPSS